MRITRLIYLFLLASIFLAFQPAHALSGTGAQSDSPLVLVLNADTAVTPAMKEYITRGISLAEQRNAELVIIHLNTPGGDLLTMQAIVTAIRNSTVPVVIYVYPRGAWAGSAGTLITLAGQAAAMAPDTAIGAASPVGTQGQNLSSTEQAKAMNITLATVRSLAERRGPKALALAESTIQSAKAASATEALNAGMIDFIATDDTDLLKQLNGFTVQMANGPLTLHTTGATVVNVPASFIEQLLGILVDPNIVFLLLAIGAQAIIIEIGSPGGWIAGFVGVVCLALAAYGLGVLPVNWFGIAFMLTSFVLFILDIKAHTHGALTVAGVISFIVGALVLFNSPGTPQFQRVSIPLVVSVGIVMGALFGIIISFALRAQRIPVLTGMGSLVGKMGTVTAEPNPTGQVQVGAELWSAEPAEGSGKLRKGDRIEVVEIKGLKVKVRKIK
jgi:membrane-bound serine protease (ClpP class)